MKVALQIIAHRGGIWRTGAAVLRAYRREGFTGIKHRIMQILTGSRYNYILRPQKEGTIIGRDVAAEHALSRILLLLAEHAKQYGSPRHWIALPFLAKGGAEMFALNLCRAVQILRPNQSVVLVVTDKNLVDPNLALPDGVLLVALDDYLAEPGSDVRKQALLRDLLMATQPHCFHNINSEVAWRLILSEGEHLKRYTRIFASIFAFQFAPDGHTKIDYAANFLKKGMPHLTGLLSDNRRFIEDAAREYQLSSEEVDRMGVLYQPCRLSGEANTPLGLQYLERYRSKINGKHMVAASEYRRPQVFWAGRLDAEKRIDLFIDVVRRCTFADFRVYGQSVIEDGISLPDLPNLSYEGAFASPKEWLEQYEFDALLFTSKREGLPNVLIEAGFMGIPVIAPTVGGVGELIDDKTGYPLPERPTPKDYEQALLSIVNNPTEALARARNLYDLVLQRHSWGPFVKAVSQVSNYLGGELVQQVPLSFENEAERPLVSVIIPCYNQGQYLYEAVSSALAACSQTMEIIIVDDGSTDAKTTRYLNEIKDFAPSVVRIHRQANRGLSGARNVGIALARGEYLQFLDADDLLTPNKINTQLAQLQVNPALSVSVCNFLECDESRNIFHMGEEVIARFDLSLQDFLYRWERGFNIPIHCGLFRRAVLENIRFDEQQRGKEDWVFWVSLAMSNARFGYLHGYWAIYRLHDLGMHRSSIVNMGYAWLQAGMKIDAMLGGKEPLFFESVVSWFDQYYRAHPNYGVEIVERKNALVNLIPTGASVPKFNIDLQVRPVADAILHALDPLAQNASSPVISVVIPVYEHFEYLQECLTSLAGQGDVSLEIICVDDGSPDERVSKLMEFLQGKNPRLVISRQNVNRGISEVQNLAVEMARGEFVAFLDCDDALIPNALKAVYDVFLANSAVDYVFTDRLDVDEDGKTVHVRRYGGTAIFRSQASIPDDLLENMVASHLKVMRRSVYRAVGGCNPEYSGVQDWELALRIAQAHVLHYLPKVLYRFRVHTRSVTSSEKISQLRKTNIVRRLYLERRHVLSISTSLFRVFELHKMPISQGCLIDVWRHGERCWADMRGTPTLDQIDFIRGYHSYFDVILWSDPIVPSALFGYLWPGIRLLELSGEAEAKDAITNHSCPPNKCN